MHKLLSKTVKWQMIWDMTSMWCYCNGWSFMISKIYDFNITTGDITALEQFTLLIMRPKSSEITYSIPWLLIPWLLEAPGHQQPQHWQHIMSESWLFMRNGFYNLCHFQSQKWQKKINTFFMFPKLCMTRVNVPEWTDLIHLLDLFHNNFSPSG